MKLDSLFMPQSMAVFGVTPNNYRHPAVEIFTKNSLRYPLKVFGINPAGGKINDQVIYPGIKEVPQPVDLAVIAVRAEAVGPIIADCIAARVGGAVVISGGFAESGRADMQKQLADLARKDNFPFVGPNCLGVFVPGRLDTFFLPSERMIRPEVGNVSLVSQSGGILVDQIIKLTQEGIGIAKAVSIGNKAVIGEIELLEYLAADGDTKVIAFYIEGFDRNQGRDFVLAAQNCGKPVVVMKSGRHPESSRVVSSHTASLAGDYEVFRAVMAQAGIWEAKSTLEMVSFCEALSKYDRPVTGRVGIVTASGGHGAMAADACLDAGLSLPVLAPASQETLKTRLSPSIRKIASLGNPVDLTGSGVDEDFMVASRLMCEEGQIDCLLVLLLPYIPGVTSDLGAKLAALAKECGKPMVAYVPDMERYAMMIEGFELNGIPVSPSIEGSVLMVEALRRLKK